MIPYLEYLILSKKAFWHNNLKTIKQERYVGHSDFVDTGLNQSQKEGHKIIPITTKIKGYDGRLVTPVRQSIQFLTNWSGFVGDVFLGTLELLYMSCLLKPTFLDWDLLLSLMRECDLAISSLFEHTLRAPLTHSCFRF